jgi:pimeloyl-ACP methyl ester carboxylesterase
MTELAPSPPELVLLPGLDGTGDLFRWVLPGLPPATVVRYPNDPKLDLDGYVSFARTQIGKRRVTILGESFSGPVAVKLAAAIPDQVSGLILAATYLRSPWPPFLVRRAAAVNPHQAPKAARDFFLMGKYQIADVLRAVDRIVSDLTPGLREARLISVASTDVRREFALVTCPVLALHGRSDWVVPPAPMRRAIASKPQAEMQMFRAAHMLLQTRPGETAAAIADFIRKLPATS